MIGFGLRPGACHALHGPSVAGTIDRILLLESLFGSGAPKHDLAAPGISKTDALALLEEQMQKLIQDRNPAQPNPITTCFDHQAFVDPTLAIADFARDNGIDQRRLERLVKRDFGLSPKHVLRRARVLDMASHLRGVADDAESSVLALRYFDQSHMIREFTQFMGQTPAQFVARPQPIMTLTLEVRQARRLEELGRLVPGARRPWDSALAAATVL